MVDAKNLMVDDAFDQIEDAPPDNQHSDMAAPRRGQLPILPCDERDEHANHNNHPRQDVEKAVRNCVLLETRHGVHREIPLVGEQMVPLQNLMQDNSVHEAAESHAQQQTWSLRRFWSRWIRAGLVRGDR